MTRTFDMNDPQDKNKDVFIAFSDPNEFESPMLDSITTRDPAAGQVLRDYKILDKIGEGAMAIVYKARQISTGRTVAIKTLKFVDQALAERFSREVSIHSNLKHKNIVEAIDCISTQGRSYFVMEFLNGVTLETQLEKRGRCNRPDQIANILAQICDALECAHSQGIIHRDVKPENVVLLDSEAGPKFVKVLDFGVAKIQEDLQRLTKTGVVLGSPAYMSPEQCLGEPLDQRSDIYSLGVVAFELITGSLPYGGETAVAMMEAHCDPDIKPLKISSFRDDLPAMKELEAFFEHVLQFKPDDRPASIRDFKIEIGKWWKASEGRNPNAVNPFSVENSPIPKREKKQSVLGTSEVKSLDKLAGRRRPIEEPVESNKSSVISKIPPPVLIGGVLIIVLGLSTLLAFVLLSVLKH